MIGGHLRQVVHYLRRTVGLPSGGEASDRQLLLRFADRQDQDAFAALVGRHGPMVLAVCRAILHDDHAAEDAFQATFLVLATKAGSAGWRETVGGWLHGVACRVASNHRAAAARRRFHETRVPPMTTTAILDNPEAGELRRIVHEELACLPEKYRSPLVLCYLEGKSNDEAAQELGWPKGSISGLLAQGREHLRGRLKRRGIGLPAAALAAALAETAGAAVPATLVAATLRAVVLWSSASAGSVAAPIATLANGVLHTMWLNKVKGIGAVLLVAAVIGTSAGALAYRMAGGSPTRTVASVPPAEEPQLKRNDAAAGLRRTANDKAAPREKRAEAIFALFAEHLKPPQDAAAVGKVLAGDAWLKDINLYGVYVLGGWIPVAMTFEDTVFCLHLFPDAKGHSDWVIYFRLSGGSGRTADEALQFLRGTKGLKGDPKLVEFALCFPDADGTHLIQQFSASGTTMFDMSGKLSIAGESGYKVDNCIDALATLQTLGKDKAGAILQRYAKDPQHSAMVIVLCRLLFTAKAQGEFRPPNLGRARLLGGTSISAWPLAPVAVVDGVPFLIAQGYDREGRAELTESYVRYCLDNCDWSSVRYKPKEDPEKQQALEKLLASPKWKVKLDDAEKKFLSSQVD